MEAYKDSNMCGRNAQHSPIIGTAYMLLLRYAALPKLDALFWARIVGFQRRPASRLFARGYDLVQSIYFCLGCVQPSPYHKEAWQPSSSAPNDFLQQATPQISPSL